MEMNTAVTRSPEAILQTNKVIRNTYILLSMTLIFSAFTSLVGILMAAPPMLATICFFAGIGVLWFVLPRTMNSGAGVPVLFLITGLFGFGLSPMIAAYLAQDPSIVMLALGGTGTIFLGLSGYALTTRKDFSFMGGFIFVGMLVAVGAILLNLFLNIPALSLAISAAVIMLMSGLILYRTSSMIHGGETNYILCTADLFMALLNIFVHLLSILGAFSGDD